MAFATHLHLSRWYAVHSQTSQSLQQKWAKIPENQIYIVVIMFAISHCNHHIIFGFLCCAVWKEIIKYFHSINLIYYNSLINIFMSHAFWKMIKFIFHIVWEKLNTTIWCKRHINEKYEPSIQSHFIYKIFALSRKR